jgi:hypothetical protein
MKRFIPFLFLCLPASWAGSMREFAVSGLRCQAIQCEAREGIMPHQLTTIEVSGAAKQWAGYSLLFRVVRQSDRTVVLDRKVGVMADGGFTTSIPAYSLPDGTYVFGFAPVAPPSKVFAAGTFTVSPLGQAAPASTQHGSSALAGHWLGIAGTIADITINADGTYVSRGAPPATWRQQGDNIIFTGPLAAWNNGRGKLRPDGKVIEFYWTNAAGAKQYFVLGKY